MRCYFKDFPRKENHLAKFLLSLSAIITKNKYVWHTVVNVELN